MRVNLMKCAYRCGKFGCTEDEFRAAVDKVGEMATDVERELKGN
jgi:hypothetical protein